jgi:hypothetical protein
MTIWYIIDHFRWLDEFVRTTTGFSGRNRQKGGGISFQSNGEKGEIFDQLDLFLAFYKFIDRSPSSTSHPTAAPYFLLTK